MEWVRVFVRNDGFEACGDSAAGFGRSLARSLAERTSSIACRSQPHAVYSSITWHIGHCAHPPVTYTNHRGSFGNGTTRTPRYIALRALRQCPLAAHFPSTTNFSSGEPLRCWNLPSSPAGTKKKSSRPDQTTMGVLSASATFSSSPLSARLLIPLPAPRVRSKPLCQHGLERGFSLEVTGEMGMSRFEKVDDLRKRIDVVWKERIV